MVHRIALLCGSRQAPPILDALLWQQDFDRSNRKTRPRYQLVKQGPAVNGRPLSFGCSAFIAEHCIYRRDKPWDKSHDFGAVPPSPAAYVTEDAAQECAARLFECPRRENPALGSVPDVSSTCVL